MIHKVTNPELKELLIEKGDLLKVGRDLTKQIDDLEQERNKIGMQIQKIKDKVMPMVEEIMQPVLKEFEIYTVSQLNAEGDIEIEYIDQVETFKEILREKEEKKRKEKEAEAAAEAKEKEDAAKVGEQGEQQANENTVN